MEPNPVLDELTEMDSPLAGLPRYMPYSVPEGYFGQLPTGILQAAKTVDIPPGYFESLPEAMLAAAKGGNPAAKRKSPLVISLLPVRRWAAAAVLIVSMGIGGALFFGAQSSTVENPVATLPADAVQEYVAVHLDELETGDVAAVTPDLASLSSAEVETYLTEEGLIF